MTSTDKLSETFLQAAVRIGEALCAAAIWDAQRRGCNWMGRSDIFEPGADQQAVRSAALGPDLYSGSAGVALFLAELYGITGEPLVAQTAAGALRRSAHYLRQNRHSIWPLSFFAGHLGVFSSARRLKELAPQVDLDDDLNWLLREIRTGLERPHGFDVIAGNAGAIPALLKLAASPDLGDLADLAVACGDDLCRSARPTSSGVVWDMLGGDGTPVGTTPLSGFSHGNTGMAVALLELFTLTRNPLFFEVAQLAWRFDDQFFNEAEGNWVDPRSPYQLVQGAPVGRCLTAWCHGAPGVALGRLRAAQLDPIYAREHTRKAEIALQTTLRGIRQLLELPDYDATLCHGLSGLAEVMLICAQQRDPQYQQAAAATTAELVRRYSQAGAWPSGVLAKGPNPSLMLGTAGVGHHLLRLHAPEQVRPVLITLPAARQQGR